MCKDRHLEDRHLSGPGFSKSLLHVATKSCMSKISIQCENRPTDVNETEYESSLI